MSMKIGVMGGASGPFETDHLDKAHRLGEAIAKCGCILITGGCPGLPLAAACGANQNQGFVIGISPGLSLDEHVNKYDSPTQFHNVLIYTGSGLMGREVVNIRTSDIIVIVGGRSGTLGELAIAYDEGKLIGILTGTGGISDIAKSIIDACDKATGAKVIYSGEPENLIAELIQLYAQSHYRHPSHFCKEGSACGTPQRSNPEMERDPVCGMWIFPKAAVAERSLHGTRYVFCSSSCARQFDDNPDKYIQRHDGDNRLIAPLV
ncbi:YHS domain-containing protein [Candidatus Sumerlaeota bacterium]|nr:YHS domain-containing protein [Candidatus Sumerlaeota bacterium]